MRQSTIVTVMAASLSIAALTGSASAQGVGVDVYAGPRATYDYDDDYGPSRYYRSSPRVYGYTYDRDERHLRRPEDYRTGSRRWWQQMDREGRGGQHD